MPDSNVTVTAEFTYADGVGASVIGHSVSLDGDIAVNFYMELDPEIAQSETAYMQFTIPDTSPEYQEQTVYIKDVEPIEGGYYVFKCRVAAKDMNSNITAQILGVDKETTVYTYSVKDYADWLIEHKNDSAAYTKAAPLVKKMLRYGAYAANYFSDDEPLAAPDVEIPESGYVLTGIADTAFAGATLSLKTKTSLSLYFSSKQPLTLVCEGSVTETQSKGSEYVIRIRDIAPNELDSVFTVNVSDGVHECTISYSTLTYCYLAQSTDDSKLQGTVKALYLFHLAAKDYFASL